MGSEHCFLLGLEQRLTKYFLLVLTSLFEAFAGYQSAKACIVASS